MIHQAWRLSEYGEDNLGLACTEQGLVLGRTPLIERRNGRFVVRDQSEIECLLSRAYRGGLPLQRLMAGLANVAKALNGNDLCLADIAAVHLRIPALPDHAARQELEAADTLIKSADWNPALHPRAGTPPNPGWFAPTDGSDQELSPVRTAENQSPNQASDAPTVGGGWVRLPSGPKRIDELADFAEWIANATPQDEAAIRNEIKRYDADVGWQAAADDLNSKLSIVLRPGVTQPHGKASSTASISTRASTPRNMSARVISSMLQFWRVPDYWPGAPQPMSRRLFGNWAGRSVGK